MYQITNVDRDEYSVVVELWEASVRATHHFLKEADIEYFKPLILNTYLDAVKLSGIRDQKNRIIGFLGVSDHNLEMFFIHPDYRGKGIGRKLLKFAVDQLGVNKVEVNEQNIQAVGFYHHLGFITSHRSELDATGKPYPILHLKLDKEKYKKSIED